MLAPRLASRTLSKQFAGLLKRYLGRAALAASGIIAQGVCDALLQTQRAPCRSRSLEQRGAKHGRHDGEQALIYLAIARRNKLGLCNQVGAHSFGEAEQSRRSRWLAEFDGHTRQAHQAVGDARKL